MDHWLESDKTRLSGVPPSGAEADRAIGALLGLAVGDALGATLEDCVRDGQPLHTEMTGGGDLELEPGQWTDDTSMALALADSLLACDGFDAADLMSRFVRWCEAGEYSCTGTRQTIGMTNRRAIKEFMRTGDPYSAIPGESRAGNGSLMRLAPAVLFAYPNRHREVVIARHQSLTTHGASQVAEACELCVDYLHEAIVGRGKQILEPRDWPGHPTVRRIAAGEWRGKTRAEISSSRYVIHTLEAALWCIDSTESFEEALVMAVNLADDADTVGAVTGQLAGAIYGASAIPERWLRDLAWRARIEDTGSNLYVANSLT